MSERPAATGRGPRRGSVRVGQAVEAYLAVHRARPAATTARAYTGVLTGVADQLGAERVLAEVCDKELAEAFDQVVVNSMKPVRSAPDRPRPVPRVPTTPARHGRGPR